MNDDIKAKMADKLGTVPTSEQMSVIPPGPMEHIDNVGVVPVATDDKTVPFIRLVTQNRAGSTFVYWTVEEFEHFVANCHAALDFAKDQASGIARPTDADVHSINGHKEV